MKVYTKSNPYEPEKNKPNTPIFEAAFIIGGKKYESTSERKKEGWDIERRKEIVKGNEKDEGEVKREIFNRCCPILKERSR